MQEITSKEDIDALLASGDQFFVLKHSSRCPVSTHAFEEFKSFSSENPSVTCVWVGVIENRPASNYLAEITSVEHASPQILHFRDGKACWNTSHHLITIDTLTERL